MPLLTFGQMVALPGGSFMMGNERGGGDEKPVHAVTLSPFAIMAYEVTAAMYDTCVKQGRCTPAHYDDSLCTLWSSAGIRKVRVPAVLREPLLPVVCVTWDQARQFCHWKSQSLPTEAQWEYAAAAGGDNLYTWGNDLPDGSRCPQSTGNKPQRIGSFQPNGWGIYDMTGNVWEWTLDRYEREYYSFSETQDPRGAEVSRYRSIRGGGWYSTHEQLRIRNRHHFVPELGEVSIGFRCVKNGK